MTEGQIDLKAGQVVRCRERELWPAIVSRVETRTSHNREVFWLEVALACEFAERLRSLESMQNGLSQTPHTPCPQALVLDRESAAKLLSSVKPDVAKAVLDILKCEASRATLSRTDEAGEPESGPPPPNTETDQAKSGNGSSPGTHKPEGTGGENGKTAAQPVWSRTSTSIQDKLTDGLLRLKATSKGRGLTPKMLHAWMEKNRPAEGLSYRQIGDNLLHASRSKKAGLVNDNGIYWLNIAK